MRMTCWNSFTPDEGKPYSLLFFMYNFRDHCTQARKSAGKISRPDLKTHEEAVADPGFSQGGAPNPRGRQDTILLNVPKNCMKSRNIWSLGGGAPPPPLDPPLGRTHKVQNRSNQWLHKTALGPTKFKK